MITIIDELQNIDKQVMLVLKNGENLLGMSDCIVYEEDEEEWETIPKLRFEPQGKRYAVYLSALKISFIWG